MLLLKEVKFLSICWKNRMKTILLEFSQSNDNENWFVESKGEQSYCNVSFECVLTTEATFGLGEGGGCWQKYQQLTEGFSTVF